MPVGIYARSMKAIALGLGLLAVGCIEPVKREAPQARLDLRAALQVADAAAVGLAIANDGERFVFDEALGLYRIEGDQATPVVTMAQMPASDKPLRLPFTDMVALAPNLFAITAIGDGFLLDTTAMTLHQHFCYVPDGGDGIPTTLTQRTDAIAYDAVEDKLYAQPLTYDSTRELVDAQVSRYNRATGLDEAWFSAPIETRATGSVFVPDVGLVLGQGAKLSRYDADAGAVIELDDLSRFGVRSIDGLAIDPTTGTLVVVDQMADAMFDIDLARISL